MSSSVHLSVVCLSVTFVHSTQAIEIFRNVSTTFGTLATYDLSLKIYGDHPREPIRRGINQRGEPNIAIWTFPKAISRKRCKIGGKLLLITNRKSHMSFRLVPKSVTLNDLERRNSPNFCIISPHSVAFGTDYLKVVEDTTMLSVAEM